MCFGCKKFGHFRSECPLEKKEIKKKKKAYVAIWDDSDSSSDEESQDEKANICLMAQEEEEENEVSITDFSDLPYDDLLDAFIELMNESKLLAEKLNNTKSLHKDLTEKFNESSIISANLKSENSLLSSKINELNDLHAENLRLKSENSMLNFKLNDLVNSMDDLNEFDVQSVKCKNEELKTENLNLLNQISTLQTQRHNAS